MEYWVIYDNMSGGLIWAGSGQVGSAAAQPLAENQAMMLVPATAGGRGNGLDLAAISAFYADKVNEAAGAFRLRFITDVPGQAETYAAKYDEAISWKSDSDPDDFPFLKEEANELGVLIEEVAAEIIRVRSEWRALGAKIEAHRRGAVVALEAADNLALIAQAVNAVQFERLAPGYNATPVPYTPMEPPVAQPYPDDTSDGTTTPPPSDEPYDGRQETIWGTPQSDGTDAPPYDPAAQPSSS